MRWLWILLLSTQCFGAAPVLDFLDITSGPKTGGENNKGVQVCAFGRNFGLTRGTSTITVGGGSVDNYPYWGKNWKDSVESTKRPSPDVACFQLGSAVSSGNVVMTTSGGTSNGLSFTVRAGGSSPDSIWCISSGGASGNTGHAGGGTFSNSNCKATFAQVKSAGFQAGDTAYILDGYSAATLDDVDIATCTSNLPCALGAYPSATVNFGSDSQSTRIVILGGSGLTVPVYYWTVFSLNIECAMNPYPCLDNTYDTATIAAQEYGLRIVNFLCQAPSAEDAGAGCISGANYAGLELLGNELKNVGCGFGNTGGLDSSGMVQQAVQNQCQLRNGTGTITSTGTSVTGTDLSALLPGDHICSPDCTTGANVKIVQSMSSSTAIVVDSAWTPDKSGASYKIQKAGANKLLHVFYPGGSTHNLTAAYNWIHNNSAPIGMSIHSQPESDNDCQLGATTHNSEPGTNAAQITLVPYFSACSTSQFVLPGWQSGDRVDITSATDSSLNGRRFVKVIDASHAYLYADTGLTTPVTGVSNCSSGTCGFAVNEGFRNYNIYAYNNRFEYQNGICLNFADPDPTTGPVEAWNNIFAHCGQGPLVGGYFSPLAAVGNFNTSGSVLFYHNIGSGTSQVWNNTFYDAGNWLGAPLPAASGQLQSAAVTFYDADTSWSGSNNLIVNTSGSASYGVTTVAAATNMSAGTNNIWYGGSNTGGSSGNQGLPSALQTTPTGNGVACTSSCNVFVDASNGDYHLVSGAVSPVGAGTNTSSIVTTDFDGLSRPNPPAIGAYEYQSGGATNGATVSGVTLKGATIK